MSCPCSVACEVSSCCFFCSTVMLRIFEWHNGAKYFLRSCTFHFYTYLLLNTCFYFKRSKSKKISHKRAFTNYVDKILPIIDPLLVKDFLYSFKEKSAYIKVNSRFKKLHFSFLESRVVWLIEIFMYWF